MSGFSVRDAYFQIFGQYPDGDNPVTAIQAVQVNGPSVTGQPVAQNIPAPVHVVANVIPATPVQQVAQQVVEQAPAVVQQPTPQLPQAPVTPQLPQAPVTPQLPQAPVTAQPAQAPVTAQPAQVVAPTSTPVSQHMIDPALLARRLAQQAAQRVQRMSQQLPQTPVPRAQVPRPMSTQLPRPISPQLPGAISPQLPGSMSPPLSATDISQLPPALPLTSLPSKPAGPSGRRLPSRHMPTNKTPLPEFGDALAEELQELDASTGPIVKSSSGRILSGSPFTSPLRRFRNRRKPSKDGKLGKGGKGGKGGKRDKCGKGGKECKEDNVKEEKIVPIDVKEAVKDEVIVEPEASGPLTRLRSGGKISEAISRVKNRMRGRNRSPKAERPSTEKSVSDALGNLETNALKLEGLVQGTNGLEIPAGVPLNINQNNAPQIPPLGLNAPQLPTKPAPQLPVKSLASEVASAGLPLTSAPTPEVSTEDVIDVVQTVGTTVENVADGVEAAADGVENAADMVQDAAQAAQDLAGALPPQHAATVVKVAETVENVAETVESVAETVGDVAEAVGDAVPAAAEVVAEVVGDIVDVVQALHDDFGIVNELRNRVWETFSGKDIAEAHCFWCKNQLPSDDWNMHPILPRNFELENLRPLCKGCTSKVSIGKVAELAQIDDRFNFIGRTVASLARSTQQLVEQSLVLLEKLIQNHSFPLEILSEIEDILHTGGLEKQILAMLRLEKLVASKR